MIHFSWLRDAKGTPSVLVHGFTGAPGGWDEVAAALPGPVAAVTLPGHCHTPVPGGGFADLVAAIGCAIAAGAGGRVRLIGYSMGARIALALALDHPALAGAVALIGAHPGLAGAAERVARRAADRRWIDLLAGAEADAGGGGPADPARRLAAFVDAWEAMPMWKSQRRVAAEALARQRAIRLGHDPVGLAGALTGLGLGAMPCYRERLGELAVPVCWIAGAEDEKFAALARTCAGQTPRARLHLVPGSGHNVPLEAPAALAAALAAGAA